MRPLDLAGFLGQEHLIGPNKPLREALDSGQLHSMIFWGPPGVGKTTLAKLIAQLCDAHFITVSAVLAGVKEIRAAIEDAKNQQLLGRQTVLFVDEVHRFNKAQQDAFLPFVEDGTVIFVGATTENPSFELNNALLSRARVYRLQSLSTETLQAILRSSRDRLNVACDDTLLERLARAADGDARRALNFLELAMDMAYAAGHPEQLTDAIIEEILSGQPRRFDKQGDDFYDQISALHKAVRGSSPDAALYWFARMIDGGCDPLYVGRRVVRMASEDIGNADPRALQIALNAWDVQERLGSPEGELALAQAVVYMACAPKSNAVYKAYKAVLKDIQQQGSEPVPLHLRNAPTRLMKEQGYGEEYRYAHDYPDAYAAGENYFPETLKNTRYYEPVGRGLEKKIADKLEYLRQLDNGSNWKRYS
ncbi:replication-associated recombination protein A [Litorivivens sp.]|uniref:replication-associated recombination protein A n=1 Tax=Litorivivens sp. TaxID=2020868 RepID=UPI003565C8F1